jgi:hypothetical protein
MADVTRLLDAAAAGDPAAAADQLPLVYAELRALAAARLADGKPGQTLQATALVHEAYLPPPRRAGDPGAAGQPWRSFVGEGEGADSLPYHPGTANRNCKSRVMT